MKTQLLKYYKTLSVNLNTRFFMGICPAFIAAPRLPTMSAWHGWGQVISSKLLLQEEMGRKKRFRRPGHVQHHISLWWRLGPHHSHAAGLGLLGDGWGSRHHIPSVPWRDHLRIPCLEEAGALPGIHSQILKKIFSFFSPQLWFNCK